MLSKSATMLLGLINQRPLNPYEIIKQLQIMNVHRWYNIANSTVYATLKVLEKKEYIYGSVEKDGNMPDKNLWQHYSNQFCPSTMIPTFSRLPHFLLMR